MVLGIWRKHLYGRPHSPQLTWKVSSQQIHLGHSLSSGWKEPFPICWVNVQIKRDALKAPDRVSQRLSMKNPLFYSIFLSSSLPPSSCPLTMKRLIPKNSVMKQILCITSDFSLLHFVKV